MTTPARGDRVGKYEILTPLTSGGMAELFLGSTIGPGGFQKHVVIKRILPDASRDENFMRMFLDEARITAGFSHPNIAQVYDLGEDEQGLYVVMEFIAGQNLNQVVSVCAKKQHVLPLGFSFSVLNDCAQALHYAHTYVKPSGEPYPVVHRDVAQKNIMVGWDGQTKLLDFGIAKAANTLSRTKVGTVKGTAGYMSPEQVTGKPVDGRSDVFSLGVVMWEMATGQRLFAGDSELAEMKLILDGKVERPDELEPVVPPALGDIIMKALSREPSDRFGSCKELSRALTTRCPELIIELEERSQFMRELFSDRIDQTRKLFELSKAKSNTAEQEVRQLARSLQESAMSQPVLKPVKDRGERHRPAAKKPKQRTAEDDKLLELAIKVDQVAIDASAHEPKRTWTGPLIIGLLVVLGLSVANKLVFPEKRISSSGLVMWEGEPEEETPDRPKEAAPASAAPDAIPGAESSAPDEPDGTSVDTRPIVVPAEAVEVKKETKKPRVTPVVAGSGEFVLALLPDGATVLKGKQELGKGRLVSFSLPAGSHVLTIVGPDGAKRTLSVRAEASKKTSLRLDVGEIPVQ
ncbi:MAG: serine/threonine protein kinase [Myxococcaceae bacterium]|nr:serine/threonine protein kinase [Myxococcaceae bacterium]